MLAAMGVGSLPELGSSLGGKYSITRRIGEGGMGVVFEAFHTRLKQRVAVKMLLPSLVERGEVVTRFEREARAAAQLKSQHVARVLDVDSLADGTPYMVMEFLQGRDLAAELQARGPLPVDEAVAYLLQACEAMAEAHRLGTVHRDLKPSNLFLAEEDGRRRVKVLDFGISKVASEGPNVSVTSTFSALGTALYMSPEQVRSAKHVDARSDVWALGIVLYELLAGRPPFLGDTATAVAAAIVADVPEPIRSLRPDIPESLGDVIMTALEKDRSLRFQDAAALAGALAPFASPGFEGLVPPSGPRRPVTPFEAHRTEMVARAVTAKGSGSPSPTAASWSGSSPSTRRKSSRSYAVLGVGVVGLLAVGWWLEVFARGDAAKGASNSAGAAPQQPMELPARLPAAPTAPPTASARVVAPEASVAPAPSAVSTQAAKSSGVPRVAAPSKAAAPAASARVAAPAAAAAPPTNPAAKAAFPAVPAPKRSQGAMLPDDPG